MALALTQVITEDRASGGQVIDGSLRFDSGNSTHLTRTPGSAGNRRTWTFSCWVKVGSLSQGERGTIFSSNASGNLGGPTIYQDSGLRFAHAWDPTGADYIRETVALFRDPSAWYHVVWWCDTTQAGTRWKIYVNGVEQTLQTPGANNGEPNQNTELGINTADVHLIGNFTNYSYLDGHLSQAYFVDGQALGPEYFGFTDPLTNTWRPKKYTGTYGTNGFYLPMDGNSPIGEDKSGNGNDWTPVYFGGSNSIEKATGALPILNTTNGGKVATVGVRTDTAPGNGPVGVSTHLILALPLVGNTNDLSNQINSARTALTFTAQGNAAPTSTQSNFYGGSYTFDGTTDRVFVNVPDGDALYLQNSNFTVECWVRLASGQTSDRYMVHIANGNQANSNGSWQMRINGSKFNPGFTSGSTQYNLISTQNYVPDKWTHVAFVREGNEQRLYIDGILDATTNYTQTPNNLTSGQLSIGGVWNNGDNSINGQIQDVRVYDGVAKYTSNFIPASTDPDILPDTPSGVAGGSALTKITDGSVYFDGTGDYLSISDSTDFELGSGDFTVEAFALFKAVPGSNGDTIVSQSGSNTNNRGWQLTIRDTANSVTNPVKFLYSTNGTAWANASGSDGTSTSRIYTDIWYHFAVTRSGDTWYLFVNGNQENSWTDSNSIFNTTADLEIGSTSALTEASNAFISNVRIVKGTALYTSNFTPPTSALTNVTNTKLLCCHSNVSADAAIVSPGSITTNGNVTATNFNPFTTDIDAVRGQESGWCTLSPLDTDPARTSTVALSNGNLDASVSTYGTVQYVMRAATFPSNGKDYFEVTKGDNVNKRVYVGFLEAGGVRSGPGNGGTPYDFYGYGSGNTVSANTAFVVSDGTIPTSSLPALDPGTSGDVLMVAHDRENKKIWFGKNGVWFTIGGTVGNPATGTAPALTYTTDAELIPCIGAGSFASTTLRKVNFGQKPFKYAPPEGFKTLCLANLPRPSKAAVRPDKYFGTVLYNGDGGTNNTVTGLSFTPDVVWGKCRTGDAALPHNIFDVVRGFDRQLDVNDSVAEVDRAGDAVTPLSNGFILDATYCNINNSSTTNVAWCWKAGGAAVSNTDGSITSSVSVNQDAGFSIATYTGNGSTGTVGHGLNAVPKMILCKNRNNSGNWFVYHTGLDSGKALQLNTTLQAYNPSPAGINAVSSSTFTLGGARDETNTNGGTYVAYCWSEVPGFSKFGSYTGNGNADGPFIHLGFKPAWLLLKRTDSTSSWFMLDTTRDTYNVSENYLIADGNIAEGTYTSVDFLSNGFKARNSSSSFNTSGATHVYAAFAEAPTFNLFGGQANAR